MPGYRDLAKPLYFLFERLTALNGLVSILDNQLNNFRDGFRHAFEQNDLDLSRAYAGFALVIEDLTGPPDQNYIPFMPVGTYSRVGEEYLNAPDELIQRWSAFTLAQSYERFDTFVRDQIAVYFYYFNPKQPVAGLKYMPVNSDHLAAWKSLFRERHWNPFSILNLIRDITNISETERKNHKDLELGNWLSVLASVRHAVTHYDFNLPKDQLRLREDTSAPILNEYFPGTWTNGTYRLEIDTSHAKKGLKLLASYSHLVYSSLAQAQGIEPEILSPLN